MWRYTALAAAVWVTASALAKTDNGNIEWHLDNNLDNDDNPPPPPEMAFDGGRASIKCDKGFFEVELNFTKPFKGVVEAVNSSCRVRGNGTHVVRLNLLYNETCGTRIKSGEFSNDITFRYHPIFVTSADRIITVKCSYGKPTIIPSPPLKFNPRTTPSPLINPAPLKTMPSLMLLCGILFLSLVLIGLLSSYYIFKRRRFQVVRQLPPYSGTGSEFSIISDTDSNKVSTYEELSIPRSKFAPRNGRNVGSDDESYHSGYVSESPISNNFSPYEPSRVLRRSLSSDSRGNKVIVHTEPKYSDRMLFPQSQLNATQLMSNRNEKMNVKEEHLINFLEQDKFNKPSYNFSRSQVPELNHHHSPLNETLQPVYSEILKNYTSDFKQPSELHKTSNGTPLNTKDSEIDNVHMVNEDYVKLKQNNTPYNVSEATGDEIELPVVASRRPGVSTRLMEDVFLKTVIEKKTVEEIEKRNKQKFKSNFKSQPIMPNWDVTIRNYPNPKDNTNEETSDWDTFSETSSMSSNILPQTNAVHQNEISIQQNYRSLLEIPIQDHSVKNWDLLIRVLEVPQTSIKANVHATYRNELTLTLEDRKKWREIITTDSTLKKLLSKATRREDFEMIKNDQRYDKLFSPKKWDEIINILVPPERYISEEGHTRNRMGSLSTVYEYDSDGTLTEQPINVQSPSGEDVVLRSRKTSRSSLRSNVRSVGELTVNHALVTTPESASNNPMYF